MESNRFPHVFCKKKGSHFLRLKFCMETILENFTGKTCYDYFEVHDITLICSLFVRILYFKYMLCYKKKVRKHNKNCTKIMSYL
jgi:hypothetical protein